MADYPVQIEKVQAPPLRDETLARDRLLDWLHVKIHRRVVLVLAEAGYGKTTLLADFTRRTRVRVSWYRLDRGDRDWLGFMAHLVAAFQVHQPGFGPATTSLIREASGGTVLRDTVLDAFIRELGTLAGDPAALVLDDFHLVDDSQEARVIVRELVARAPERVTFVLISRKTPSLPLARLRSLGEVVELHKTDLRFAQDETERLFRETYALDLEQSVVAELSKRTEGWVASLQLVRAAIRERNQSEIRSFVRSLSGAEGNLYDYLAEEVIGELSGDLQQFLMRTSLLETIEPVLGRVAAGIPVEQTRASIADGEMLGLFSRIGPNTRDHVRAHPLVRDFLEARLRRSVGAPAVIEIHRAVAAAAEPLDWRIAGHHYLAAGDLDDARRVLASAIETILATGAYAAAETLVTALPPTERPDPHVLVILSRLAQQRGQSALGRELAEAAYVAGPENRATAVTVLAARLLAGDVDGASAAAAELERRELSDGIPALGRAIRLTLEASLAGRLSAAAEALESVADLFRTGSGLHYLGVALSNLGYVRKAQGDARAALEAANEAIESLEATSAGVELLSARLLRAWAVAHLGDLAEARRVIAAAADGARGDQLLEVAYESGEIEALYGDPAETLARMASITPFIDGHTDAGEQALVPQIHAQLSSGRLDDAIEGVKHLQTGARRTAVAFEARRGLVSAMVGVASGRPESWSAAAQTQADASRQGAQLWSRAARLVAASAVRDEFSISIHETIAIDRSILSIVADVIALRLDWIDPLDMRDVSDEVRLRPERWRGPLRRSVAELDGPAQASAAVLLDEVGTAADVALLRKHARSNKRGSFPAGAGRGLARRLAPIVRIEDLGRMSIAIGDRTVDGSVVRRKVLSLLAFLLTRGQFSAARDEVLEALWPDLDPSTAQNSLNQTVYFLRRVFEPSYAEETSPGYLGHDGETVWLDVELVESRSDRCRRLIRALPSNPDPTHVIELAQAYRGRFSLDFIYEDWAYGFRDSLHAAYLRIVDASIRADTNSGHYSRGIELAQLAMDAAPEADDLQLALTRLYRLAGSLAAAAEQYENYARTQRDLGLEPEPFDRL
ncbi:MAG: BTAD domain-containing putative transcriptional regulator [Chloroflexota bacterium]